MNVVIKQMHLERITREGGTITSRVHLGVFPQSYITMSSDEYKNTIFYTGSNTSWITESEYALNENGNTLKNQFAGPITAIRGINVNCDTSRVDVNLSNLIRNNFFPTLVDCYIGDDTQEYTYIMMYENPDDELYYINRIDRSTQSGSAYSNSIFAVRGYGIYHNLEAPYIETPSNIFPTLSLYCSSAPYNYMSIYMVFVPIYLTDTQQCASYRIYINQGRAYIRKVADSDLVSPSQSIIDYFEKPPAPTKPDIADCTITVNPLSFIYDGQPKTPTVTVYNGETILSEGTDYVKTYENNIYAGVGSVLVAGIGEYTGSQRLYFTISASGPPDIVFQVKIPQSSYDYTGEPITPPVLVFTNNGTILTENTDYTKTYENNINVGRAAVLVAGINSYSEFPAVRAYFDIVEPTPGPEPPKPKIDFRVTLPKYSYDYTGEPITPYVNVVTIYGTIMVEGTDYQKTYQNNTNIGQASVLVVGINDYSESGSKIVYFNIVNPAPDPYSPLGPSGPAEGQGTFNPVSDTLPAYTLPTLNISNTGFTRIYNPTLAQVQALARYMWTDPDFFQTLFNKLIQVFENPMDAVIAFNIVPCAVPDGGTEEFKVLYLGTGVSMTVAGQQYVAVDCGTATISEFFGSALDYNPYTKIKCYLPYIGTIELDTDEVMNETLHLIYTIDIVSGACIAQIYIDDIPIYQFSGHCAQYIPMAASDFSSYVSALIGISKIVAGAVAAGGGGGESGAVTNTNGLQLTGQTIEKTTQRNPTTGRQVTTGTVATEQWTLPPTQASFASQVPGIIANTVGQVVGSKLNVAHTGTFSGASGFMAYANPFIRIERPRLVNPAEYGHFNGRPSMITRQLNQLSGYTVIQQIQLTGFTCTQPEMEEISTLLKGGVVF